MAYGQNVPSCDALNFWMHNKQKYKGKEKQKIICCELHACESAQEHLLPYCE